MQYKKTFISGIVGLFCAILFVSAAQASVPMDFTELVKKAGPAVVNISTEKQEEWRMMGPGFRMFRNGDPFMERFFEQFEENAPKQQRKSTSLGSGFIISADGYIVTNNHVVEGADVINVTLDAKSKDKPFKAEIIGTDPDTDLALLKIDAEGLPSLSFGDSDSMLVGEWVIAIGNPLGLDHTVTAGILSAKGRNIQSGNYDDFLQTDASINPGNSGGPLLNMKGEVIGINSAMARYAQGIGFAIPSSLAQKIIGDLRADRKVSRGWLGVTIQGVDEPTAKALGMKEPTGALVGEVLEGHPAEKGGIKAGDVILSINGQTIENTEDLLRKVANLTPGKEAKATLWRDGKEITVTLNITERDSAGSSGRPGAESDTLSTQLGIKARTVTSTDINRMNLGDVKGLLITDVKPGSLAAESGLRPGDVIIAVNKKAVYTVADLEKMISISKKEKGALLFQIQREGKSFFRAIDMVEKDTK